MVFHAFQCVWKVPAHKVRLHFLSPFEGARPLAHGHSPGDAAFYGLAIQPARERHRSSVDTQRPGPRGRAGSGKGKAPRLSPLEEHLSFKKESTVRTDHVESEPVAGLHTKDCDPQDQG